MEEGKATALCLEVLKFYHENYEGHFLSKNRFVIQTDLLHIALFFLQKPTTLVYFST
jgi:hypothetical protein